MMHYLLVARSITQAQQMAKVLEQRGISAKITRAKAGMTGRGCGYTVRVPEKRMAQARFLLREKGIQPAKVFRVDGADVREVLL